MSTYPGRVIVTEPKGYVQPRINVEKQTSKHASVNGQIVLSCIAQGHPPPSYKWFKEFDDQLLPLSLNDRIYVISEGLLKISKVKLEDSGKYLCWVNNSAGEETIQITLTVTAPLSVHLQPQVQVIDVDKNAEFQCIVSGFPGSLKLFQLRFEIKICIFVHQSTSLFGCTTESRSSTTTASRFTRIRHGWC